MIATDERLSTALAGRYQIGAEVGRGGMAVVHLATDLRHGRRVAIKVLRPEIAAGVGAARFLDEIRNTAALQHPHILPLFDSGEADGLLFYVMPFIEGENLRVRLDREGALSFEVARGIAAEIADALDHAHRRGILHRDIKPENILLADRHAVVADFGIGRAVSAARNQRLTQANFVVGTPAYVSPEQASGESTLDGRSDLYSLGCLLFEMLTSRPPFGDSPAFAVLHRRLYEDAPDVLEMRPDVPEDLRQVVQRLLARDPADRFATGADVAAALAGGSVTPVRFARSTPRVSPHPSIAVLPFVNLSADPDTEYFSDGITDEIISVLARIPDLRVAARTSAFSFKGTRENLRTIGERLKVATVLEGSVRRQGDRVRINVQLSDVTQGYHLWSERFDREFKDIFAVQDEIASMIAARLSVRLLSTPPAPLRPPSRNLEAYDLYLRGRYQVQQRGAGVGQALASFREAIAKDPRYALPYTGLAEAYPVLSLYEMIPSTLALTRGRAAADRALALDPGLMEAHQAAGVVEFYLGWNLERAEEHLRQAIELAPRAASPRLYLSQLTSFTRRHAEARAEVQVALDLEPLSPLYLLLAANALSAAGDLEAAEQLAAQGSAPDFVAAHYINGLIHLMRGRNELAAETFGRGLALFPQTALLKALRALALANVGQRDEAEATAAELERNAAQPVPLGVGPTAALLWCLGRRERAVALFERGFEDHAPLVWSYPLWVPGLGGLASDPCWPALLETVGLGYLAVARS